MRAIEYVTYFQYSMETVQLFVLLSSSQLKRI